MTKWFKKAVYEKPPYNLGGWSKNKTSSARRQAALSSRPKNWSLERRRLSAGRALTALANVNQDQRTQEIARRDARYFYKLAKKKTEVLK